MVRGRVGRFRPIRRRRGVRRQVRRPHRKVSKVDRKRTETKLRAAYGQQITVQPPTGSTRSAVYVTAEAYDIATPATKNDVITVTLNQNRHMAAVADLLWVNTLANSQAVAVYNTTTYDTSIRCKIRVRSSVKYELRNASTDFMFVRMYTCKPRQDLNMQNVLATDTSTTYYNLYNFLSRGFAINGLDPGNFQPNSNAYMAFKDYSPFDSQLFTKSFKIMRAKRIKLRPGEQRTITLHSRPFIFDPSKYFSLIGFTTSGSWRACDMRYLFNKFERFNLFQVESSIAGYGAAQTEYTKLISNTTPTLQMHSDFVYHAYLYWQRKTSTGLFEERGNAPQSAGANTIVNTLEGILAEEKDAV